MTQKIAIYEGEGSSLLGIRDLDALYLSKESLLNSDWDAASTHFILPGGRDRPYHAAFRGAGNRKIRAFVEKGGTYIGLCAGAYACALMLIFCHCSMTFSAAAFQKRRRGVKTTA